MVWGLMEGWAGVKLPFFIYEIYLAQIFNMGSNGLPPTKTVEGRGFRTKLD